MTSPPLDRTAIPLPSRDTVESVLLWGRLRPWFIAAGALALGAFVAAVLHQLLRDVRYTEVIDFADGISPLAVMYSMLATGVCHLVLIGHDTLAVRHLGATVRRSTLVLTSFAASAIGHAVGLGEFSNRAMRQRLYLAAGLEPPQIARAIGFDSVASGLGWSAFGAIGLLFGAHEIASIS
ncbi:MAG: mprF, partial [Rhizobacter sp.]|nr:mprF [Rhizobacter sp.]